MSGDNGELQKPEPREVEQSKIKMPERVLLQVTIDAQNKLQIKSSMDKEALTNLLIDALKMVYNSNAQKSRIVTPGG